MARESTLLGEAETAHHGEARCKGSYDGRDQVFRPAGLYLDYVFDVEATEAIVDKLCPEQIRLLGLRY